MQQPNGSDKWQKDPTRSSCDLQIWDGMKSPMLLANKLYTVRSGYMHCIHGIHLQATIHLDIHTWEELGAKDALLAPCKTCYRAWDGFHLSLHVHFENNAPKHAHQLCLLHFWADQQMVGLQWRSKKLPQGFWYASWYEIPSYYFFIFLCIVRWVLK